MADISIQRILATEYFLLQIQTLLTMIVVRITNYNSAFLQLIVTAGRAKSSNKMSRLVIK